MQRHSSATAKVRVEAKFIVIVITSASEKARRGQQHKTPFMVREIRTTNISKQSLRTMLHYSSPCLLLSASSTST